MLMNRISLMALGVFSLSVFSVIGLEIDPPGRPNEDGHTIAHKLDQGSTPLDERFEYFSHYSPAIRILASRSMQKEGAKALPYLIKGLRSKDRHVVRASCDAISGVRGFFGVDFKPGSGMTPELAAPVVPYLVPLLDREDFYVQAGALQALSKCGKAAAPHLGRVVALLDHKEWWVRVSAGYVLEGVGSPEADPCAEPLARAILKEQHAMCLNHMTRSLKALMQTASTSHAVAVVIGKGLSGMEHDYIRGQGLGVLSSMGTKATVALPDIEALVSAAEAILADTAEGSPTVNYIKSDLANLAKARDAISGARKP